MNTQNNHGGMMPMQPGNSQSLKALKPKKAGYDFDKIIKLLSFALLVGIFAMTAYMAFFNNSESVSQRILRKAAQVTTLTSNEVLGATVVQIENVDDLKAENEIQKEIYKDVQNGDYAVLLSNRMIVYREPEHKIVYEGNSPSQQLNALNQAQISKVVAKAKSEGLVAQDSTVVPQVLVVQDVESLKKENPQFYQSVDTNDLIVIYSAEKLIFIYRPSTDRIISIGTVNTSVSVN
jgi:hypothetical protein